MEMRLRNGQRFPGKYPQTSLIQPANPIHDFQSFVAKHKELIKDISNVTCAASEGENAGKKINSVETNSICLNPYASATNLLDILSVILALLSVCTIGKLLYDYSAYRKTGRLPWLVSKMP